MGGILYDARLIKAYERLQELGAYVGEDQDFVDKLWLGLVTDEGLMNEFIYYLDNHSILDETKIEGYGITDLYMWELWQYNIKSDIGKNFDDCNKELIVLYAFRDMLTLKTDPERLLLNLSEGFGNDML